MNLLKISVAIENLLLDPNNPRFADISNDALNIDRLRFSEPAIQALAYEKMNNPKFDTLSLANSIATVGFVPVDNIVVSRVNESQYYVIEGNRRATAIKFLLKQYEIGQTTLSELEIGKLRVLDVLLVDEQENQLENTGMIIQGIRNVSGIREWDAFQKAQFINDMIEKGKQPGEISRTIGMTVKEINRYYKTYSVMLQFKTDEEYAEKWKPSFFSYFDEVLKKPALRSYLKFNDESFRFDNIESLKQFYDWIVPDEDGQVTITDAHQVRRLSELVGDRVAISYLDDRNFDKAVNYINHKNFNQNKVSVTESINKIQAAISALKNMVAEGLEKELSDEDFLDLKNGVESMVVNMRRVETLKNNG